MYKKHSRESLREGSGGLFETQSRSLTGKMEEPSTVLQRHPSEPLMRQVASAKQTGRMAQLARGGFQLETSHYCELETQGS